MLDLFRAKLKKSRFARNVLMIAKANILGQLLLIAIAPILVRLFTPAEFGIAAAGLALAHLITSVASWRFDRLIPNMLSYDKANRLFVLAFLACVLVLVCWFAVSPLAVRVFDDKLSLIHAMALLVGLSFVARTGTRIIEAWFVRHGDLKRVSGGKLALSVTEAVASIVAGLGGLGATGLMLAYALAPSAAFAYLVMGLSGRRAGEAEVPRLRGVSSRGLLRMLSSHGWLATVATASAAVNSLSMTMMIVALGIVFSAEELGYFALIRRMTLMPVSLISTSLQQGFWSQAAEYARNGKYIALNRLYLKTTGMLGGVAIALVFGCYVGSLLVVPVFGANWAPAGPIFLAMTPYLAGVVMFMPTNHLIVFNRQGQQIFVDATRIFLVVLIAFAAHKQGWGLLTTVWMMSFASFLGHLMLFVFHLVLLRIHRRQQGASA